jgi:zinc transporter 9
VRQGVDPNVTVVLLEDMAAVTGVVIAGACMGIAHFHGSAYPDAIGSFLIAGLLGVVASFIIKTNISALVGKSVDIFC